MTVKRADAVLAGCSHAQVEWWVHWHRRWDGWGCHIAENQECRLFIQTAHFAYLLHVDVHASVDKGCRHGFLQR